MGGKRDEEWSLEEVGEVEDVSGRGRGRGKWEGWRRR